MAGVLPTDYSDDEVKTCDDGGPMSTQSGRRDRQSNSGIPSDDSVIETKVCEFVIFHLSSKTQ